jgi:hypothetical protein
MIYHLAAFPDVMAFLFDGPRAGKHGGRDRVGDPGQEAEDGFRRDRLRQTCPRAQADAEVIAGE